MEDDFIQNHPEMREYWDTLPYAVKGMIVQCHPEISTLGELQCIAESILEKGETENG